MYTSLRLSLKQNAANNHSCNKKRYTGWTILITPPNFLGIYTRYRKMFWTKVEEGRGGHPMVSTTLTLVSRSVIFSNGNLYFWRRIWRERKILRIRCSIGQGRFKKIWKSNRRKWVKLYWFKMWIFLGSAKNRKFVTFKKPRSFMLGQLTDLWKFIRPQ